MKKILVVSSLAITLGLGVLGCGSTWWENFQSNPVAQVQTFESTVQIGLNGAQVAWTFLQPYLPPAQVASINQVFQNAIATVNHSLSILNDAVAADVAAKTTDPNFTALMAAVSDAFNQVLAIIAQYTQSSGDAGVASIHAGAPAASSVPGLADATDAALRLQAYAHH